MSATAVYTDGALVVTVVPDITQCAGLDDLDGLNGDQLDAGVYVVEPTVEEFCGVLEETLGGFQDLDEESSVGLDGGFESLQEQFESLQEQLEGFVPQPVDGDDRARFASIGAALAEAVDTSDVAQGATAGIDGTSVTVVLMPGTQECLDVPVNGEVDEIDQVQEVQEIPAPTRVDSGLGVSSAGPTAPAVMVALGLLLVAFGVSGRAWARSR